MWQSTVKHFLSLGVFLSLAACQEKKEPVSEESEVREAAHHPVEYFRQDWPIARGGAGLSGEVGDALPLNPEIKWTFKSHGPIVGEAVVSGDTVIIGDSAGFLTALDLMTGDQKWQKEYDKSFEAAPAIHDGTIFIGCEDSFLYALDLATGDQKWSVETNDKITAGVNVTSSPDGSETWIVLNGYDGICRALKSTDGSEIWKHETDSPINGTPAIVDGKYVVFGGCDHFLYTLDLATGKSVKDIEGEAPIVSTVGTRGTFVAWANHANEVMGADITAGKISWDYSDRKFPFMAAPAINETTVFIGGRDKKIHAISRETGKRLWRYKTGSRVESSAILFDDGLVCGSSDGRLYALSLDQGEEIWKLDLGESFIAAASFTKGLIIIGSEGGTLFAIGAGE